MILVQTNFHKTLYEHHAIRDCRRMTLAQLVCSLKKIQHFSRSGLNYTAFQRMTIANESLESDLRNDTWW
jgi:hypothetical protein